MTVSYPAFERNREPIAAVLETRLPEAGTVLEIASGPAAHAAYFAHLFPGLEWQPTDVSDERVARARAHVVEVGLANLLHPIVLDAGAADWPVDSAAAVLAINLIHISPHPRTAAGLFSGAARVLDSGAPLFVYGPFFRAGHDEAPSNLAFDLDLRGRDPNWGIRELGELEGLAEARGLALEEAIEMPANNLTLVFRRR